MAIGSRVRLAALFVFVVLAILIRLAPVQDAENSFLIGVHQHSSPGFDHFMLNLNAIAGPKFVYAIIVGLALISWFKHYRFEAIALVVGPGLSGLINLGLRAGFHRHRPELWHTLIYDHSFVWSFPSGHACLAATLSTAVCLRWWDWRQRIRLVIGGVIYSFVVAATTIILGVHYPLDIVAGWLSGWLVVSFVHGLLRSFEARIESHGMTGHKN